MQCFHRTCFFFMNSLETPSMYHIVYPCISSRRFGFYYQVLWFHAQVFIVYVLSYIETHSFGINYMIIFFWWNNFLFSYSSKMMPSAYIQRVHVRKPVHGRVWSKEKMASEHVCWHIGLALDSEPIVLSSLNVYCV